MDGSERRRERRRDRAEAGAGNQPARREKGGARESHCSASVPAFPGHTDDYVCGNHCRVTRDAHAKAKNRRNQSSSTSALYLAFVSASLLSVLGCTTYTYVQSGAVHHSLLDSPRSFGPRIHRTPTSTFAIRYLCYRDPENRGFVGGPGPALTRKSIRTDVDGRGRETRFHPPNICPLRP